ALAGGDGAVTLWDVVSGRKVRTLRASNGGVFPNIAFTPDGQRLIFDNKNEKAINLWDLANGKEIKAYQVPNPIMSFSADRRRLAFAGEDQTAKIWNVDTGQELLTLQGRRGDFTLLNFSPDGQRLASS